VPEGGEPEISTEKILRPHLECFGADDLQGLLSDYSQDIAFFDPDGVIEGTAGFAAKWSSWLGRPTHWISW
jgi:ketosteroid isomerase-like protein